MALVAVNALRVCPTAQLDGRGPAPITRPVQRVASQHSRDDSQGVKASSRRAYLGALAGLTGAAAEAEAALGPKGQALKEKLESGEGMDFDTDKLLIGVTALGALGTMVYQATDYKSNIVDKAGERASTPSASPAPTEEATVEASSEEKTE